MRPRARKTICGNCRHHQDLGGDNGERRIVQCRLHPPTVFTFMIPVGKTPPSVLANPQGQRQVQMAPAFPCSFPTLDPEFWCSDYEPELAPAADNDS